MCFKNLEEFCFIVEMAPKKKVVAKKPKSEEGASRGQVHFNAIRCLGNLQELRFKELSNRRIWS